MDSVTMAKAQQILSTFNDEELQGFILMFSQKKKYSAESQEDRRAEKLAAAERIAARRVSLPADFDERRELLDQLDERYGI